jgi:DNA invertase Pin-like site-specific DNA recombinase
VVVVIFEENDISASKYSKKERPDFRSLIELIRQNEIDVIFATEVERLVKASRQLGRA